ncbi:MAG: ABC transporter ATP-binding protein [Deltaproteobacteria bacterium]|nr:ABC transporter ATP-binding protein [Deltaproteobacteria bacterium]
MYDKPVLTFESVSIAYPGEAPLLRNICFQVDKGERLALVGLNGSGKTTLMMACVGLVPHTGHIYLDGISLTPKTVNTIRENIGFLFNVPEDQLLFPEVLDDVCFGLKRTTLSKAEKQIRCEQMLHKLNISYLKNASIHQLSHGQKQRAALAGAMVSEPKLLLLDEPTSGLDPIARNQLIQTLTNEKSAMIIATHDLNFAGKVCDRCLFVENGRVDTHFSVAEIHAIWSGQTS